MRRRGNVANSPNFRPLNQITSHNNSQLSVDLLQKGPNKIKRFENIDPLNYVIFRLNLSTSVSRWILVFGISFMAQSSLAEMSCPEMAVPSVGGGKGEHTHNPLHGDGHFLFSPPPPPLQAHETAEVRKL
jgi:hypothetical protein